MVGPTSGSRRKPRITSASPRSIFCTRKPSSFAFGACAFTRFSISRAATDSGLAVRQAERHAARLGLVGDVGRQDLERDRAADLLDRRRHAPRIGHGHRLRHRHAERREQRRRLALVEAGAAGLERLARGRRRLGELRLGLRRRPQQAERHRLGAEFGMAERRHAGRGQQGQRLLGRRRQRHRERLLRAGELQQAARPPARD